MPILLAGTPTRTPFHSRRLGLRVVSPWANGLIGGWAMTEGSGNVVPDLAKTNDGVMTTMTGLTAWGGSQYGVTVQQGTGNEYLLVKSSHLASTLTNASVFAWVRNGATNIAGGRAVYGERGASGNDIWKLSSNGSTVNEWVEFTHRNTAGSLTQVRGGAASNDNVWHCIGVTKSGSNVVIYLDGVQVNSTNLNGNDTFSGTVSVRIGSDEASAANDYEGDIFGVFLWDRTLTNGEVMSLYTRPFIMFGSPAAYHSYFIPAVAPVAEKWFITSG